VKHLILICLLVFSVNLFGQTTYTLDSTVLTSRVVKTGMDIPWEIIWGPDDHIWATERYGRVSRINPETGSTEVLLDLSADVYERSETGMLGMALHPDFENTPHVFIAYTYFNGSNIRERLVKFEYDGTILSPLDTLIEDITGNTTHVGCRLIFLADNTLLMSTGDAQQQSLPQDTTSVVGKILRMHMDGSIPSDNPNPSSLVYSFGHRNAQGLWLAPNGILYSSEHGPTTDDELNIITPNANYGWPTVTGFCDSPPEEAFCTENNVVEPLAAWTPTIAPSDIIWYNNPAIPELKDKLLLTVLKDKSLIAFDFNAAGDTVTKQTKYFKNDFGRLRDICISPNGKIYLATSGEEWTNTKPFTHSIIELSNEAYSSVSISERSALGLITLGPNPIASGAFLRLNIPHSLKGQFTLYDVSGRVVLSQPISTSPIQINSAPGIYFWRLASSIGTLDEGKLVVE
jgi:glucose/arabinose dehydrogenase